MKSWKAEVNGQGAKMSRLGLLSLVTWMVVSLSAGTALAEDGFKLWKLVDGKAGEPVAMTISTDREKEAASLLVPVKAEDKPQFASFVEKFSQPTEMLLGIRAALLSVKADEAKFNELKKSLKEELPKVDQKVFGGIKVREAVAAILERIEKLSAKDLEDMIPSAEFLKALLEGNTELLAKLVLTDKKEVEVVKKDEPKENPTEEPTERDPVPPVVGEQDLSFLDPILATLGQLCNKVENLLADDSNDRNLDVAREVLNQLKALSRVAPVQEQQVAQNGIGNEIPNLLKALGEQQQPTVVPPSTPPSVASTAPPQSEDEPRNTALDQQLPPPPAQQTAGPMPYFPAPQASSQRPQIALDLPTNTGARERRAGQDAVATVEDIASKELPQLMNPYTGQLLIHPLEAARQLGVMKGEVDAALKPLLATEKSTKDRIARLDSQIEELKEGGRAALPSWVKKEQARLQSVYEEQKRNFEQQRQSMTAQVQQSQDPNAQAQVSQMLGQMAQEMNRAKTDLDGFNADVESKVEEGNKQIAKLKSDRDYLQDTTLAEIAAAKGKLEARRGEIASLLGQNQQAVAASMPQQGAVPNVVNRIQNAAPRTATGRGLGGAFTSTAGTRGRLGAN